MINSLKRSIRLKNKQLLAELDLKNDADTDPPVSADFKCFKNTIAYILDFRFMLGLDRFNGMLSMQKL